MAKKPSGPQTKDLRARAERFLAEAGPRDKIPIEDVQRLVHELQVHQTELDMQNQELRRAQEVLEEARSRYEILYDFAPVGYCTLSRKGKIIQVNLTGANLLGVKRSLLIDQPFHLWLVPEFREAFRAHLQKVFETGGQQTCELKIQRHDGAHLHVLMESTVKLDDKEAQRQCHSVLSDISARKQAEEALQASEEKYRSLFEHAVEGIFQSIPEGAYLSVNPTMARILGFDSPQEMLEEITDIGEQIWVYPEKRQEMKQLLADQGSLHDYEIQYRRRDGKTIWVSENIRLARSADGQEFYEGFVVDITERKQAEADLRQIQWLLSRKTQRDQHTPAYGDLTELNTNRLILDSVGSEMLQDLVGFYLDALETSAAVYEKNGDYACGIFSSGWCRFMDAASRNLCNTQDNRVALDSGKWGCHESCWTECSKVCIDTGEPVDIECFGGIRLYGAPLWSNKEVIGAINFGYGAPPLDSEKLQKIADKCQVSVDMLRELAQSYKVRPTFVIDLAKERLMSTARLIGEIVIRKQAEEEILRQREELRGLATRLSEVGEMERHNIAQELHDEVCQNLASISIVIETLALRAQKEPLDQILSMLNDVGEIAEKTNDIARNIMEGLRPTALEHYGFEGGLRQFVSQFSQQTGIAVDIMGEGLPNRLTAPIELALFRITQEALANAAKHSKATQVNISLEENEDVFRLTIADNGMGFSKDKIARPAAGKNWGLIIMGERARAIGGACRVESQPGQGTRVVMEVPC